MKLNQQCIMLMLAIGILSTGCSKQSTLVDKAPIEVKVTTIVKSDFNSRQSFSGTIEEESGSALSFPIAGTIKTVCVAQGQKVHKGQLIAILDDASFLSTYDMAKALLDQAYDAYNRMKILHDNNSLPDIQWVDAESKLRQAQSSFEIAKKNLGDTKLYAPFSGYISEKNVEVGNNVMPGSPVVKLVTVDNVKVTISVPETEISKISIGNDISIQVPALGNRSFIGKVNEKGVAANSLSRSYEVKALVHNADNALLPGMLCTLYLGDAGNSESAILIPTSVVQLDSSNHNFVWVAVDGVAIRKFVELGQFSNDKVVIASGLAEGDNLIIEGQQKVSDNMKVTIIK